MKIIYKRGDLLQCEEKYILHGCNAQGVMGSGVAKLIRAKYPSAYSVYLASKDKVEMKLGCVTYAEQDDGKVILNAITQDRYGHQPSWGKTVYVSYDAVRDCMQRINWLAGKAIESVSIAMPKIGSGLGGGDWNIISDIIETESVNFQAVVYEL